MSPKNQNGNHDFSTCWNIWPYQEVSFRIHTLEISLPHDTPKSSKFPKTTLACKLQHDRDSPATSSTICHSWVLLAMTHCSQVALPCSLPQAQAGEQV